MIILLKMAACPLSGSGVELIALSYDFGVENVGDFSAVEIKLVKYTNFHNRVEATLN